MNAPIPDAEKDIGKHLAEGENRLSLGVNQTLAHGGLRRFGFRTFYLTYEIFDISVHPHFFYERAARHPR